MSKFKKLQSGEWVVVGDEITRDSKTVDVTKADGTTKTVRLSGHWTKAEGVICWKIVDDKTRQTNNLVTQRRTMVDRYDHHVLGVCEACEFNADAGDGRGCPRHRGDPRA